MVSLQTLKRMLLFGFIPAAPRPSPLMQRLLALISGSGASRLARPHALCFCVHYEASNLLTLVYDAPGDQG